MTSLPSEKTFKFCRDLVIFLLGMTSAVYQLFLVPHPDIQVLGVTTLCLFGPGVLHYKDFIR